MALNQLIQSIFYSFEMFSRRREGLALRPVVDGSTYEGKTNGPVCYIDSSAILNDNSLHVFSTNRGLDETASVRVELADLAGVEVEEYYALLDPVPVKGEWFEGVSQPWAERLKVRDEANTHVVARYGPCNGWLDDQVAITERSHGKGLVYTVGAYLDDAAQQKLVDRIAETAGVRPVFKTPAAVEARVRVSPEGKNIYIFISHKREKKVVRFWWSAQEHLSGRAMRGQLTLAPYGVAVLTHLDERDQATIIS